MQCGSSFMAWASQKKCKATFCSKVCSDTYKKGRVPANNSGLFKKGHHMPKGTDHYKWKGGLFLDRRGYRHIRVYDDDGKSRLVREHRLIMERHLGRPLGVDEVVHHKDGNKLNNTVENLYVTTQSEHVRIETKKGTYRGTHNYQLRNALGKYVKKS